METSLGSIAGRERLDAGRARPRWARSNPSRAGKRVTVALFALVGAAVASWLAAYQLGLTGVPWDPLFDGGTREVLRSSFSRSLPFPDAGLGAIAYLAEIVALAWGRVDRYRTNAPAVFVYAGIAGATALGSLGLVLVQAFVVHAFCTLSLVSAAISFVLVVPAATELAAVLRHLRHRRSS